VTRFFVMLGVWLRVGVNGSWPSRMWIWQTIWRLPWRPHHSSSSFIQVSDLQALDTSQRGPAQLRESLGIPQDAFVAGTLALTQVKGQDDLLRIIV
jgi:hypothetical protein